MALPVSRNRTYAVGSPVVAADLNAMQDGLVAHNLGAHGDKSEVVSPFQGPLIQGAFSASNAYWESTGTNHLHTVKLPLIVGDRLKSFAHSLYNAATPGASKEFTVYKLSNVGGYALVAGWQITPTGSPLLIVIHTQDGPDVVVGTGEALFLRFVSGNGGDRWIKSVMTYDHP
jgi:hypothetical protein